MRLEDWEPTIQKIVDETNHEPNERRRHKIFTAWRSKLEREPTLLSPHQIDEIVREVRRRFVNTGL